MNTIENEALLNDFSHVIEQLIAVSADITRIEEEKAMAASQKQHDKIDGFLKDEQVYILKLRGLEQKRIRLAESAGWKNLTFRQILGQAADHEQALLSPLFTALDTQLKLLTEAREASDRMIRLRLREFNTALSKDGVAEYDEHGDMISGFAHHFHDRYV